MNFGSTNFKILASITIALLIFLWLFPRYNQDQQSVDLSPIALEVFDNCINAAFLNRPLSNEELAAKMITQIETSSPPIPFTLNVELEDDFECLMELPKQYYDRKLLHERLVQLKSTRFDDRLTNCRWRLGKQVYSILSCFMKSKVYPENIFQVSFIISFESTFFLVQPRLIYDTDGPVRLAN